MIVTLMRSFSCKLPAMFIVCAVLSFSLECAAATPIKTPAHNATSIAQLRRSDPGYLQYLESKSLLGSSRELARIVSGSQIMWHAPATDPTPERLLQIAATWLSVHPIPLLTRRQDPVFNHLANPVFSKIMRQIGVEGLYISPSSGTGALWHSSRRRITDWEGMVQLAFTDDVGDDRDYGRLLGRANQDFFFLGLEMTQTATGLGPDFFLGARGNPEFQRLYRMLEILPQFWTELPKATEEWDCKALSVEQVKKLVEEKVLPAEDPHVDPCGVPWGWAVTGLVLSGEEGKAKRFAYRYYLNPRRPIMDWEEPLAGARRILSACAIRRVGTQGAALLGMQTRALQGLNPGAKLSEASPEPALSAAVSIGREVRRYGAWTWLEDELSLPQLHAFLRQGPDFAFDSVSSPGAEHALLTGNAELVRFMYDEARRTGLEQRRLVRRLPDERGLSYALPHLCALENANGFRSPTRIQEQAKQSGGAWAGSTLYAGGAGLAALALNTNSSSPAAKATIRQGQTLLLFFKAMQPGLFMLPARELLGTLPLDGQQGRRPPPGNDPVLAMHGAYNLLAGADDAPAGKGGLPRAAVLYPPLDVQEMRPAENFLKSVGEILRIRKQTGIAAGRFITRLPTKNPGSIALLFALPGDQGAVLTICNFSRTGSHESFSLNAPEVQPFARGGIRHLWGVSTDATSVNLGPWQGTAFLLGKMPDTKGGLPSRPKAPNSAPDTTDSLNTQASPHTLGIQALQRGEKSYVIQPGDQLNVIAVRYKVTPEALMQRNNIPSPDFVPAGRTLIIPAPGATPPVQLPESAALPAEASPARQMPQAAPDGGSAATRMEKSKEAPLQENEQRYVVQSGDVLARIAARHKVRVEAIMQRNNISSPDRIVIGHSLIIPAPDANVVQAAASAPVQQAPPSASKPPQTLPDSGSASPRMKTSKEAPLQENEQRYVVQSGDVLARIAARHKVRVEAIMQRNNISSPDRIVVGHSLIIPAPDANVVQAAASVPVQQAPPSASKPPQTLPDSGSASTRMKKSKEAPLQENEQRYVVQSGDVLARIAARYKVRVEAIMQRNNISSPDRIVVGHSLIIPAPDAPPTPQSPHAKP